MLPQCFAGSLVKTFVQFLPSVKVALQQQGTVIETARKIKEIKVHMQMCVFEYLCARLDDSRADFV